MNFINYITNLKHLRLIFTLFILVSLLVFAKWSGMHEEVSVENFKFVFDQNIVIASFSYFLLFAVGNILQIPGWIFLGTSILILGPINGYLLTVGAAIFSAVLSFYFVRLIGGKALRKIETKWVEGLLNRMDKCPIRTNIILRLVFQTAPPVNYTLALSGVRFKHYLSGAIIGLPLPIYIYTFFIDTLMENIL